MSLEASLQYLPLDSVGADGNYDFRFRKVFVRAPVGSNCQKKKVHVPAKFGVGCDEIE